MSSKIQGAIAGSIRIYSNYISPLLPAHCRFYPSCSHYTRIAIETHGICQGAYLGMRRILKCHPWHEGGIDYVPGTENAACHATGIETSNRFQTTNSQPVSKT